MILGGLLTTTLLDMLITPAMFWKFGRSAAEQALKGHASEAPRDAA